MVTTPDLVDERNPWDTDQLSENHENDEKSMFVKSTQDTLGDTMESLEMLWSVPESSEMIPDDFQAISFFMIFA